MKKKSNNIFIRIFSSIGRFFDKILITPLTKLFFKFGEWINDGGRFFDKMSGNKSFLLIISLILAFSTFIVIDKENDVTIDQYAEILYQQPVTAIYNEELYVVEGLPDAVDITLVGQKRHIFLAKQSPAKGVSVDLTGLKPGNHKVTLKYTQRLKSLDYKLDPSQVTVTIYEKESENKNLTYDILHQDKLDNKLYISNIELDRNEVIVKGARYVLDKIASVKALIDVNSIPNPKAGDITIKDIPLVAYDDNGEIIDVEIVPKTITAKITITSPSKEIPVKLVPVNNLAFGKSIKSMTSSVSKVTVYGEQAVIDSIEQLEVEIDVKGLEEDKEYNVRLKKPKGITEISVKTLTVKVEVDNSSSKEFENISVQSQNLDSKYKVQALTEDDRQVTVVVKGSEESLKGINETDIKAFIDLKDYGVGTHEVEVQVTGSDLKLTYVSKTKKVKIKISEK